MHKKIIILLVLLTGLASFSFGEAFYSFTNGLYRFSESFLDEDYGREQNGINFNFGINFFPGKSFLGAFIQTSLQGQINGFEWDSTGTGSSFSSESDIRFYLGPSAKFGLGNKVRIPVSVGPVFAILQETGYNYYLEEGSFYEALNLGLFLDGALVFNPSRWFFLKHGFLLEWDFLHLERGMMSSQMRTSIPNVRHKAVPYAAFFGSIYFGIGIRIE